MGRKPKFVIVDPFLNRPGNHHFEYAFHLAEVASRSGFDVHVAGATDMDQTAWPDQLVSSHAVFRPGVYGTHTLVFREADRPTGSAKSWWRQLHTLVQRYRALRHTRMFERSLQTVLERIDLDWQDHVFVATMSISDIWGFVKALKNCPQAIRANWHLQFHFELTIPRGIDAASWLSSVRQAVVGALAEVRQHRLLFYSTTRALAEYYETLALTPCVEIPYPVRSVAAVDRPAHQPCLISCAGHMRRDKGRHLLPELIDLLWKEILEPGVAQLVLQGSKHKFRHLSARLFSHPTAVRLVPYPLAAAAYRQLIASTDIALFLYEPTTFRRRCSGVLVEMLAAGVPVVVPADCWLADQVQLANSTVAEGSSPGSFHLSTAMSVTTNREPGSGATALLSPPHGKLGLVARSPDEFAAAIKELIHGYSAYRSAAVEFASSWSAVHSPENALQVILGCAEKAQKRHPSCLDHGPVSTRNCSDPDGSSI